MPIPVFIKTIQRYQNTDQHSDRAMINVLEFTETKEVASLIQLRYNVMRVKHRCSLWQLIKNNIKRKESFEKK